MSRYQAYLAKVSRNREQFREAQKAYDNMQPPEPPEDFDDEADTVCEPDYENILDRRRDEFFTGM